jgi:uncharacterized protein YndB with AHSA1/START domain
MTKNKTREEEYKTLTIIRIFNVPREKVWQAWTDPKQLSRWWGPKGVTNPVCEIDLRVGGTIHVVMLAGPELGELAGQRWPMKGVFQEIQAPSKLVFKNQAVDEAGKLLIDGVTSVLLEDENGKTKLTLTATAKPMVSQANAMIEGMEAGWTQSIDKLTQFIH